MIKYQTMITSKYVPDWTDGIVNKGRDSPSTDGWIKNTGNCPPQKSDFDLEIKYRHGGIILVICELISLTKRS